jgi:hypothetical protein
MLTMKRVKTMHSPLTDIGASGHSVHSAPQIEGYTPVPVIDLDGYSKADLIETIKDRRRFIDKAITACLIVPLLMANVILYGLLFVNKAAENIHEYNIAQGEQ